MSPVTFSFRSLFLRCLHASVAVWLDSDCPRSRTTPVTETASGAAAAAATVTIPAAAVTVTMPASNVGEQLRTMYLQLCLESFLQISCATDVDDTFTGAGAAAAGGGGGGIVADEGLGGASGGGSAEEAGTGGLPPGTGAAAIGPRQVL